MTTGRPPLAALLPPYVARQLQNAAFTPIPENDPLARLKAIDSASEWVKQNYPSYFKKEKTL